MGELKSLAALDSLPGIFDMGWTAEDCYGGVPSSARCFQKIFSIVTSSKLKTQVVLPLRKAHSRCRFIATTGLIVLLLVTGCKTLAPFSQTMRTRVAAARQWTDNGVDAVRRGAVSEARNYFSKASSQMPQDHEIVVNLARTHFQEGQYQSAIQELNRAIKLNGQDEELIVELGQYLLADGQVDAASERVGLALQKNHRSAAAWLLSGKVHAAAGDHQAALGDYQKAIGIDPRREDIQLEIVRAYRQLNNPLQALSAVENVLEQYPVDQQPESVLIEKSQALAQLKQDKSAVETLQRAIAGGNQSQAIKLAHQRLISKSDQKIR